MRTTRPVLDYYSNNSNFYEIDGSLKIDEITAKIDTFIKVTDEDSAHTAREVTRSEGLFVGYTSGAAMQAVKQLNKLGHFNKNSVVVIIFPDHGSRYMSKIYSDTWMIEQGFFDTENEEVLNKIEYI